MTPTELTPTDLTPGKETPPKSIPAAETRPSTPPSTPRVERVGVVVAADGGGGGGQNANSSAMARESAVKSRRESPRLLSTREIRFWIKTGSKMDFLVYSSSPDIVCAARNVFFFFLLVFPFFSPFGFDLDFSWSRFHFSVSSFIPYFAVCPWRRGL